jgi:hypothetical protein
MIITSDPDGTGRIEFPDFLALMSKIPPENDAE